MVNSIWSKFTAQWRVSALTRKLLRDLRLMWSQALTIAMVVASGTGSFVASLSAFDSLAYSRDVYYAQGRFADVFASLKRAPNAVADDIARLPGVAAVDVRLQRTVRVDAPDSIDPITGLLIGVDRLKPSNMNLLNIRRGRMIDLEGGKGGGVIEAMVSEGFAQARKLRPGDRVSALINGKRRQLLITGTVLSPEFIFAGFTGMPDLRSFGVLWVDKDALAAAFDMGGAFNQVSVRLAPQASEQRLIESLNNLLAPYGGFDAHGRDEQMSHRTIEQELNEQRIFGTMLPSIFLAVAAFLLNVVLSRVISTQREQIATLKALGYANATIGLHYLKLVLVIVTGGLLAGIAVGDWLGAGIMSLYTDFFRMPQLIHRIEPWILAAVTGITLLTAVVGTLVAITSVVRLAPAEAMRAPAPGRYHPTLAERLGLGAALGPAARMVLRQIERKWLRSMVTITGIAASIAIAVLGSFWSDSLDYIIDTQFNFALREDVDVWLVEASEISALHDMQRLPGVTLAEPARSVSVRFSHGHLSHRGSIRGTSDASILRRITDLERRVHRPQEAGLLLTDRLADKLEVQAGDVLRIEVLDGARQVLHIPVQATVQEMMGLNAYIERRALNRLLGEADVAGEYALSVPRGREDELLAKLREVPRVAATFSKATLLRNMEEISARNIRTISTVMTVFASIIAVGVVYNSARIALAERAWELASLRVLGFTRAEVSSLLLGELAVLIALAMPFGLLGGYALALAMVSATASEQFYFPVQIEASTYAMAALTVIAAGMASAFVVRRRIDKLDLVAVLKTRE
jgi:putative ABC transport system permease protein